MKKIFSLFCAMTLVLSVSANTGLKSSYFQAKKAQQSALKAAAPTQAHSLHAQKLEGMTPDHPLLAAVGTNFTMTAGNITYNSAEISITPADLAAPFIASYLTAEEYEATTEAAIAAEFKDEFDFYIAIYGMMGETLTYADFANTGAGILPLKGLEAETEYVALAYKFDTNTGLATSVFDTVHFTTTAFTLTGDTIQLQFPGWSFAQYYQESNDYYASGDNGDYAVSIDWFPATAGTPVGNYTDPEDFDFEYCVVYEDATEAELAVLDAKANVTIANDTLYVDAYLTAEDGNVYHFILKNYEITAKDTIEVEFTEVQVSDEYYAEYGIYAFAGACEDYLATFFIYVDPSITGTYGLDNMDEESQFGSYITMRYLSIYDATFTIVASGSSYALQASVLCTDENLYNLTIDPTATPLENIFSDKAAAQKAIKDGQLVIEINGKRFNVLGAQF